MHGELTLRIRTLVILAHFIPVWCLLRYFVQVLTIESLNIIEIVVSFCFLLFFLERVGDLASVGVLVELGVVCDVFVGLKRGLNVFILFSKYFFTI